MVLNRLLARMTMVLSGLLLVLSVSGAQANNAGYKLYWNGPDDSGNYNKLFTGKIDYVAGYRYGLKQRRRRLAQIDRMEGRRVARIGRRRGSSRRFRHGRISRIGARPRTRIIRRSCRTERANYLNSGSLFAEQAYRRCRRGR